MLLPGGKVVWSQWPDRTFNLHLYIHSLIFTRHISFIGMLWHIYCTSGFDIDVSTLEHSISRTNETHEVLTQIVGSPIPAHPAGWKRKTGPCLSSLFVYTHVISYTRLFVFKLKLFDVFTCFVFSFPTHFDLKGGCFSKVQPLVYIWLSKVHRPNAVCWLCYQLLPIYTLRFKNDVYSIQKGCAACL